MQTSTSADVEVAVARAGARDRRNGAEHRPAPDAIDWEAAIRDPAFLALVRSRRRFVVPAAAGAFAWIALWLVLVAYDQHFMGRQVVSGVSIMYVSGLSQFVVAWSLAWTYLRRSRLVWQPLERRAIAALEARIGGAR